jgi:chemotaxis protein CheD
MFPAIAYTMMDKLKENSEKIHLNIGEVYITQEPSVIWTILGSCISIVFFNKRLQIGGICHAQLPDQKHRNESCKKTCPVKCSRKSKNSEPFKFVTCSAQYMLEQFNQYGIQNREIEVKLFGGANVFQTNGTAKTIGSQNLKVAMEFIQKYNLHLVNQHIGGKTGITIYFHSHTGKVFLKKHNKSQIPSSNEE